MIKLFETTLSKERKLKLPKECIQSNKCVKIVFRDFDGELNKNSPNNSVRVQCHLCGATEEIRYIDGKPICELCCDAILHDQFENSIDVEEIAVLNKNNELFLSAAELDVCNSNAKFLIIYDDEKNEIKIIKGISSEQLHRNCKITGKSGTLYKLGEEFFSIESLYELSKLA